MVDKKTRDLAFWLQDKIYREGLEPIGFMKAGRRKVSQDGADIVAENIRERLK